MSRGDYLAKTAGGTQTAASGTGQGGAPAGMTFSEAASNPNIMSQQEAVIAQAQQQQQQNQQQQNQTNNINNTTPEKEKKGKTAEEIAKEKAQ